MDDPITHRILQPLPKLITYIGYCCREWVLAAMVPVGRCGLCGERPEFLRKDDDA
jgi:hypothetical protein